MVTNVFIFLVSLILYAGYGIGGLLYLLCAIAITYGIGLLVPRHPWSMWIGIGLNAGTLILLRLNGILGLSLIAPLGASYFALQLIAYLADIRQGKYPPERNLFRFALYAAYYPKLTLGPIERFDRFSSEVFGNRHISWEGFTDGAVRALWGLFKKLVVASRAGMIVTAIAADPGHFHGAYALIAMILYTLQLYADFSGGIDIVLGISRMLGIRLSENFDRPFFSESVQEFWQRWHITLGSWLRDYIYIPLGGNRKGKLRKYINTVITFLVSGFWHGLHYLLWGLLNGVFVCLGSKLKTRCKTLNRCLTFLVISLLFAFYVWPDNATALSMLLSLVTTFNYASLPTGLAALGMGIGEWIVLLCGLGIIIGKDIFHQRISASLSKLSPAGKTAVICALALAVLVFGMYGLGFQATDFIYGSF